MSARTSSPRILTADQIWAAQDITERTVVVPQWNGAVRIRTFSKRQADRMRLAATTKDRFGKEQVDNEKLEALLFTEGVIDPQFSVEDYERLQDKSAVAVGVILRAIMDASGLSQLAVTEAEKSAATGSDTQIRVLPSTRVGDDAGGVAAENVGE